MKPVQEKLEEIAKEFLAQDSDMRGLVLAGTQGQLLFHQGELERPERIAAMVATAIAQSARISTAFDVSRLGEITIAGEDGALQIFSAGPQAVLAVLSSHGANVGLISLEARDAGKKIAEALGSAKGEKGAVEAAGETAQAKVAGTAAAGGGEGTSAAAI